ncbi:Protein of unknown function [Bacillus mycoides]|nr:Protein of unknown function [Bacillus mycoides]SCM86783.1 Protein of unknown function [Bacillus mycoides]SCM94300.1 Protein of unknown function [Bacillus mycoides]SCM95597.1 Protein of unknown function [Bacillus cereus]
MYLYRELWVGAT